jgi:hypothetical protein
MGGSCIATHDAEITGYSDSEISRMKAKKLFQDTDELQQLARWGRLERSGSHTEESWSAKMERPLPSI